MFALIQVGERSGTGLCNLYHIFKKSGFEQPEIIEKSDPDRIILRLQLLGENVSDTVDEPINDPLNDPTSYADSVSDQLSDDSQNIYEQIRSNTKITREDLAQITGKSLATVRVRFQS